jgi:hypothetical protein
MVARRDQAQRDQSMKGDDQSSASSSVQSMTHMTPPQAVNTSNSETPGKTPMTAPPKTPANNTKAANAAKVTPSSPTNPDVTTKTKSSLNRHPTANRPTPILTIQSRKLKNFWTF